MNTDFRLERFLVAQDQGATYGRALQELRRGSKQSHWMWFIFPQLAGLGRSETAREYAISGLDEARAYLAHPELGPRLLECVNLLMTIDGPGAIQIFGPVDAQKLRSSMTLFACAAPENGLFRQVLDLYFDGHEDENTTSRF